MGDRAYHSSTSMISCRAGAQEFDVGVLMPVDVPLMVEVSLSLSSSTHCQLGILLAT